MSLNSIMEIGKSGLNIYQMATEVTSQNISNVNTPGYSRQQVQLETGPSTTANGGFLWELVFVLPRFLAL